LSKSECERQPKEEIHNTGVSEGISNWSDRLVKRDVRTNEPPLPLGQVDIVASV